MRLPIDTSRLKFLVAAAADELRQFEEGEPRFLIGVSDLAFVAGSDPAGMMDMAGRHQLTGRRSCSAHACRDAEVVCGRVELIFEVDARLGLTARERRFFIVRFLDRLEPALHAELSELVRRRGAVARRAAERMDPIEIVYDDPLGGLQRIIGAVQPPQRRNGDLQNIRFGLRELT